MTRTRSSLLLVVLATCLLAVRPAPAQPQGGRKAELSLVPSVSGVAPGERFEVGVRFQLEEGWHIYWKNSGDSGLPPHIDWELPPGFQAGEPAFPVPKRHHSPGNIVTNILAGEPMLLVEIAPPDSLDADSVTLSAEVMYLICAENCIREEATVSVDLPVLAAGATAEPANERLLRRARRGMPKEKSDSLTLKPKVAPPALKPGSEFELILDVAIKPGLHIQSHEPALPSLIPADVFLERVEGVDFGAGDFPTPKKREVQYLGVLTEYEGKFAIRIPGEVADDARNVPGQIAGVFAFQACNDKGNCFPPEGVRFAVDVGKKAAQSDGTPPAGGAAPPADAATPQPSGPAEGAVGQAGGTEGQGLDGLLRRFGLVGLLVASFLYGLFINATPCVLPLLSIKVLGFVQQAHESRRRTAVLGLAFGAGVVLFFVLLGLLASRGQNVLQHPEAVIVLGAIIVALSLSMLGVYTLQAPAAATTLEAQIHSEGILASFGKGALAPVLGFACTGPLLAGAWGWAVQQPPLTAVLAFVTAGLGMAAPYMLLGANPNWLGFLPKPGPWMITFERIMGFVLLAMVVWMIHPLSQQIGPTGLEWTLVFYIAVALACWLLGKVQVTMSDLRRWRYRGAAATIVVVSAGLIYGWIYPIDEAAEQARAIRLAKYERPGTSDDEIGWRLWSPEAVKETVQQGKIAFVDFTAAYCTVCKANKFRAIDTEPTRKKFQELGVVAFQGDFTDGDPDIHDTLQRFSRAGVPLNLIYPAGRPDAPIVLEPNLSQDYLLQKLDEAAAIKTASAAAVPGHP